MQASQHELSRRIREELQADKSLSPPLAAHHVQNIGNPRGVENGRARHRGCALSSQSQAYGATVTRHRLALDIAKCFQVCNCG
jgi:hypothetical protein